MYSLESRSILYLLYQYTRPFHLNSREDSAREGHARERSLLAEKDTKNWFRLQIAGLPEEEYQEINKELRESWK